VIYHANCADGFSAAWCFWRKYGENADYHPGVYGETPPDVLGRDVFLVDFSYKRAIVEMMLETPAQSVTLIDHHKTALDDLKDVPFLNYFTDLNRSGAMLAWDFLYPDEPPPLLLNHIQDRDLWRFKLPNTREIQAYVFSFDYTFESYDYMMKATGPELLKMTVGGAAIERKHHKDIAELLTLCQRTMVIGGFTVPVACLPYTMVSDAANVMATKTAPHHFAACYWDTPEHRIFGLRSITGGMDVSEIAKEYGGGGHVHAAGFKVPRDHELATA
jgi:oligoribonuclease NrnB/cAMP/cGMP phosphodiesterase (DHH superfamily)